MQTNHLKRLDVFLDELWKSSNINAYIRSERLLYAMQYSSKGGKKMRAALVYASCELFVSGDAHSKKNTDACAAAVELFHAFTLIHDDLPAMDDDDLRRGQPSCHRAFDEATAILAGDTLHAVAFLLLAELEISEPYKAHINTHFTKTALAVMSGQMQDVFQPTKWTSDSYEQMCLQKTAALFETSVVLGALSSEQHTAQESVGYLQQLGRTIGLAFQLQDDLLDVESTSEQLGKQVGSDAKNNKSTAAIGDPEGTKKRVAALFAEAEVLLSAQNWHGTRLAEIVRTMQKRNH